MTLDAYPFISEGVSSHPPGCALTTTPFFGIGTILQFKTSGEDFPLPYTPLSAYGAEPLSDTWLGSISSFDLFLAFQKVLNTSFSPSHHA